jgi:uncharacterized protein with FMN-binding domain
MFQKIPGGIIMSTKKKGLKVLMIAFIMVASVIVGCLLFLFIGLDIQDYQIKDIEISQIQNGIYTGESTGSRFGNTLEVTVRDGNIVDIRIIKDMIIVIPDLSVQVFDQVKAKQSLHIDSMSGATVSVKAYLKSLERALDDE